MSTIREEYDTFLITYAIITSQEEAQSVMQQIENNFLPAFKEQSNSEFLESCERALENLKQKVSTLPTNLQKTQFDELQDILLTLSLREEGMGEGELRDHLIDLLEDTQTLGKDFMHMVETEVLPPIRARLSRMEEMPKLILEQFVKSPPFSVVQLISEEPPEPAKRELPENLRPRIEILNKKKNIEDHQTIHKKEKGYGDNL